MPVRKNLPVVLITGAAGGIGTALCKALRQRYRVVGLDRVEASAAEDSIVFDITSKASVDEALERVLERYGKSIGAVIHLAAYFDFTGQPNPLYESVNVTGTRNLIQSLQRFDVGRFIYSGTMLVHAPAELGARINEETPIEPAWAYPQSKARAEEQIRRHRGNMPCALLHLAGLYDERTAVPTLSHQIARIYERDIKSRVFAADPRIGQSFLHREDMIDAIRRTVDRRESLPEEVTLLIGEPDALGYGDLQDEIGRLIHGVDNWRTFVVPKSLAKAGAQVQVALEPVVPDAIDKGEKPFIRPFMIDLADDHYALDISAARRLLGWKPRHNIVDDLPRLIDSLQEDPVAWYEANGISCPEWLASGADTNVNPNALRLRHRRRYKEEHARHRWAAFANIALGSWLLTSPPILGHGGSLMAWSDMLSGLLVMVLGVMSLSSRLGPARWGLAGVGLWLLFAPLVFWTPSAAVYLNDTIVGMLVIGFSVIVRPAPGLSPVASESGPVTPPGWSFSPSTWSQRLPIILLAFVGFYISRYLTAYQLGHIEAVWDPFFTVGDTGRNGTETVITSSVSKAWPVPDAGIGAVTYALEILVGMIGSSRRWRTMPWLVVLFGFMIVPLGAVSIVFIIIQPIIIGTWCTLCLIAAVAMVAQIPYSLDELVATGQFLARRKRAGRSLVRVFFTGDTDDGAYRRPDDEFKNSIATILKDVIRSGVTVPWNLGACLAIGVWLMLTRLTLGTEGAAADADHLIGSLVIAVTATACAEVARPVRFLNMVLGLALMIMPFIVGASWLHVLSGMICGAALIGLSIPRGAVYERYGAWKRYII